MVIAPSLLLDVYFGRTRPGKWPLPNSRQWRARSAILHMANLASREENLTTGAPRDRSGSVTLQSSTSSARFLAALNRRATKLAFVSQRIFGRRTRRTIDVGPWQILEGDWLRVRHLGLETRFSQRDLVPFARRLDYDDVACWDGTAPHSVHVIHDFCAPGCEVRERFPSFLTWLFTAQEEAKDYDV
jgi:hypothetical protein